MHALAEGDQLLAYSPSGQFTDEQHPEETKVYIAGSIGITPVLSMIRTNIDKGIKAPMSLFYGMKSTKEHGFL